MKILSVTLLIASIYTLTAQPAMANWVEPLLRGGHGVDWPSEIEKGHSLEEIEKGLRELLTENFDYTNIDQTSYPKFSIKLRALNEYGKFSVRSGTLASDAISIYQKFEKLILNAPMPLSSANDEMASTYISSLKRANTPEAVELLASLINFPDSSIQIEALAAIEEMYRITYIPPKPPSSSDRRPVYQPNIHEKLVAEREDKSNWEQAYQKVNDAISTAEENSPTENSLRQLKITRLVAESSIAGSEESYANPLGDGYRLKDEGKIVEEVEFDENGREIRKRVANNGDTRSQSVDDQAPTHNAESTNSEAKKEDGKAPKSNFMLFLFLILGAVAVAAILYKFRR